MALDSARFYRQSRLHIFSAIWPYLGVGYTLGTRAFGRSNNYITGVFRLAISEQRCYIRTKMLYQNKDAISEHRMIQLVPAVLSIDPKNESRRRMQEGNYPMPSPVLHALPWPILPGTKRATAGRSQDARKWRLATTLLLASASTAGKVSSAVRPIMPSRYLQAKWLVRSRT